MHSQFVTVTVDRLAGDSHIYIGGVDVTAAGGATHSDFATNNNANIGWFVTSNNFAYSGAIDEIRIFNTVLSPTEVAAAYAVPEPGTCASLLGGLALLTGLRRCRA